MWFKAKCKPWSPLPSTQAWRQLTCLLENLQHRGPWQSRAQMGERRNQSWTSCVHPQGSLQCLMPELKVVFPWCLLQNLQTRSLRLFSHPFTKSSAKDVLLSLTPRCTEVGTISKRCLTFPEGWGQGWEQEQKPRPSHCSWQVHSHWSTADL